MLNYKVFTSEISRKMMTFKLCRILCKIVCKLWVSESIETSS